MAGKRNPKTHDLCQTRPGIEANDSDGVYSGFWKQLDEFGGTMRDQVGRETWESGRDALSAWQFRRGVEPLVQTADPVAQTIQIERP